MDSVPGGAKDFSVFLVQIINQSFFPFSSGRSSMGVHLSVQLSKCVSLNPTLNKLLTRPASHGRALAPAKPWVGVACQARCPQTSVP